MRGIYFLIMIHMHTKGRIICEFIIRSCGQPAILQNVQYKVVLADFMGSAQIDGALGNFSSFWLVKITSERYQTYLPRALSESKDFIFLSRSLFLC